MAQRSGLVSIGKQPAFRRIVGQQLDNEIRPNVKDVEYLIDTESDHGDDEYDGVESVIHYLAIARKDYTDSSQPSQLWIEYSYCAYADRTASEADEQLGLSLSSSSSSSVIESKHGQLQNEIALSATKRADKINKGMNPYEHYALYKFQSVDTMGAGWSTFRSQLGEWYVKWFPAMNGASNNPSNSKANTATFNNCTNLFLVCASLHYPAYLGLECMDELSLTYMRAKGKWMPVRRQAALRDCCYAVAHAYNGGTLPTVKGDKLLPTGQKHQQEHLDFQIAYVNNKNNKMLHPSNAANIGNGTDLGVNLNQLIDGHSTVGVQSGTTTTTTSISSSTPLALNPHAPIRMVHYSHSIRLLQDQVTQLQEQMQYNLQTALSNGIKAEELQVMADDLVEQSKLFKKNAHQLRRRMWLQQHRLIIAGTAAGAAIGAAGGFLAGGPAGAAVLTGMSSVAAAQVIESGTMALVAGSGAYWGLCHAGNDNLRWLSEFKFLGP